MGVAEAQHQETDIAVPAGGWALRAFYLVFWGWLLLRWTNDYLIKGLVVAPGAPFVDPATLAPYSAEVAFAVRYLPRLAGGAWLTLLLTVAAIAGGFVIAVPLSVARVYGHYTRWVALVYTELIRGTPMLAQLFVLYYGLQLSSWVRVLPFVGVGPIPNQAFWVAIIGLIINSSAYQGEYIRAAIESVDVGQLTAARAVGLSQLQGIRYVVLPQGLRYAIPAWSNELIYLIKYSSLAAFITVPELYEVAKRIASQNFQYVAIFSLVAIIYLGMVITASNLMEIVADRVAIPGLGHARSR